VKPVGGSGIRSRKAHQPWLWEAALGRACQALLGTAETAEGRVFAVSGCAGVRGEGLDQLLRDGFL